VSGPVKYIALANAQKKTDGDQSINTQYLRIGRFGERLFHVLKIGN